MHIEIIPSKISLPVLGEVNTGVLLTFGVSMALCLFCIYISYLVRHKFTDSPGKFQALIEMAVSSTREYCINQAGAHVGEEMAPYTAALALFIFVNCFIEYFAFKPATGDLTFTFTLGLCTFILMNVMGVRHKKLSGRLHYFLEPVPVVAPFKIISEIAAPVSLACRLYGNVLAGIIVMELLYAVIPIAVPGVLSLYFTLFHALIQSYVFITLTLSYIKEVCE